VAFISTVPAKVIVGNFGWQEVGISLLIATVFLLFARKIWKVNINRYSSTGS